MLNTLLLQIVSGWPEYLATKKVDRDSPMHQLVVDAVPGELRSWTPDPDQFKFVGSDGQGNITLAPWFGVFHRQITETAQDGYYIVYLVSQDLERLVLEIGFGYTQFERVFGKNKKMLQALDVAVVKMQQSCLQMLEDQISSELKSRINSEPIRLADKQNSVHANYEKCGIYSLTYELDALPNEQSLREEFLEFLQLYTVMAESLLLPEVGDYAFEAIKDWEVKEEVAKRQQFHPHPTLKRKKDSNQISTGAIRRHSKRSDKVGRLGEECVYKDEVTLLGAAGRSDLAGKIIWHRQQKENRTPGWDITSFTPDGEIKLIEVKASEGSIHSVSLTPNEWIKAKSEGDSYYIYVVENLIKSPTITELRNPAKYVADGMLEIKISEYELSLRQKMTVER